jgi:hypothetical protein
VTTSPASPPRPLGKDETDELVGKVDAMQSIRPYSAPIWRNSVAASLKS